jgi:hypothetical protein
MNSWKAFSEAEPELASSVRHYFDLSGHKVLGTLTADGAPRLSGIELQFCLGEVFLGSMLDAAKAKDLLRDPRLSVHSAPADPGPDGTGWVGDSKLSGRAVEVTDKAEIEAWGATLEHDPAALGGFHLFRIAIDRVALVELNEGRDAMVVTSWTPSGGVKATSR